MRLVHRFTSVGGALHRSRLTIWPPVAVGLTIRGGGNAQESTTPKIGFTSGAEAPNGAPPHDNQWYMVR